MLQKIIFWCFGSPQKLITRIEKTGFQPIASLSDIPVRNGIAARWSSIIAAVIIWNALFYLDIYSNQNEFGELGVFSFIAIVLLFVSVSWLKRSDSLQKLVLKPGRSVNEIRPILHLLQFISGAGAVALSIQLFAG